MTAPVVRVAAGGAYVWCPGCAKVHRIALDAVRGWSWNDDVTSPTFWPSLLVTRPGVTPEVRCHSFIRDGHWEYLPDSTHPLAMATVPMVPIPDRHLCFVPGDQDGNDTDRQGPPHAV